MFSFSVLWEKPLCDAKCIIQHTQEEGGREKGRRRGGVFAVYAIALPGAERRNGERGSLLSPLRISPGALIPWQKKGFAKQLGTKTGNISSHLAFP